MSILGAGIKGRGLGTLKNQWEAFQEAEHEAEQHLKIGISTRKCSIPGLAFICIDKSLIATHGTWCPLQGQAWRAEGGHDPGKGGLV